MSFPHWVTDDIAVLTPVIGVLYFIYQLMQKNALLEFGRKIDESIGKLTATLGTHVAEDAIIHKEHDRRLSSLEGVRQHE